ncbi:MAG: 2-C-methyl-D-erythritol 2,4-cyclodiphosphate synthase [Thermoleophilia bacterium]|nr:2-C-methyl-D-erythritol 2,4-cyclodiphosphate synthase [Thermoleophilia bacterium]
MSDVAATPALALTTELAAVLGRLRVGTGVDVHPFVEGRPLILGGVTVPSERGLEGHSDADLVAHAVTHAVLGVAGMADIGTYFPSDDPSLEGADSMELLRKVVVMACDERAVTVISVDVIVIMQAPKLAPFRAQIAANIAQALRIDADRVTVRATTTDHLGFVGRGEGASALATCLALR